MKGILFFLIILLFCGRAIGQGEFTFIWPLDTPCVLTGNYGELRPNHFHAGIDLSTGGRINKNVYAVEEGYISRIRVSAGGYGKCIYITHPNKKVTVYAHLNKLGLKISDLVKAEQYARKRFEVELLPAPNAIKVVKGEVIGLSGNSGGSTGPHLHFEIRDEESETPLNPLDFYRVSDKERPRIEAIAFYDLCDTLNPVFVKSARILSSTASQTFVFPQTEFGFAFAGHDRIYSRGNKNNIYQAELYCDGSLVYAHRLRSIDFADNRYVNEFSDVQSRIKFQKCFVPTNYPPKLYDSIVKKGRMSFNDTLPHKVRLIVSDEAGNEDKYDFAVRSTGEKPMKVQSFYDPLFVNCTKDFVYEGNGLKLYIPAGTLYRATQLRLVNKIGSSSALQISPILNFKSAMVLGFEVPARYARVAGKLVLQSGSTVYNGVAQNDSVYFYLKNTGTFELVADLQPPTIRTAVSTSRLAKMRNLSSLSFIIEDKLSGIASYGMHVNNKWVIAEYDAKYRRLTYFFDKETPPGPLNFLVEVEDRAGNSKKYNYRLQR